MRKAARSPIETAEVRSPNHDLFDLGNLLIFHFDAQGEGRDRLCLLNGAEKTDLPGTGIGELEFIRADCADGAPQPIADFERHIILGEFYVLRPRQPPRVLGGQRRKIMVHHAIQTRAVAIDRLRGGASLAGGMARRGEQCTENRR